MSQSFFSCPWGCTGAQQVMQGTSVARRKCVGRILANSLRPEDEKCRRPQESLGTKFLSLVFVLVHTLSIWL